MANVRSIVEPSGVHADTTNFGVSGPTGDYEGQAFSSCSSWESFADGESNAAQHVYLYDTGDCGMVLLDNWASTPTATAYALMRPQDGHHHGGDVTAGAYINASTSPAGIALGSSATFPAPDYAVVRGIRINATYNLAPAISIAGGADNSTIEQCLIYTTGSYPYGIFLLGNDDDHTYTIRNNRIIEPSFIGILALAVAGVTGDTFRVVNNDAYLDTATGTALQVGNQTGDRSTTSLQIEGNATYKIPGMGVPCITVANGVTAGAEYNWIGANRNAASDGSAESVAGQPYGIASANPKRFRGNLSLGQMWTDAASGDFTMPDDSALLLGADDLAKLDNLPAGRRHEGDEVYTAVNALTRGSGLWNIGAGMQAALDHFGSHLNWLIQIGRLAYYYNKWRTEAEDLQDDLAEIADAFEAMTSGEPEAALGDFVRDVQAWQIQIASRRKAIVELGQRRLLDPETVLTRINAGLGTSLKNRDLWERLTDKFLDDGETVKRGAATSGSFAADGINTGSAEVFSFGIGYCSPRSPNPTGTSGPTPGQDHYGATDNAGTAYYGDNELANPEHFRLRCIKDKATTGRGLETFNLTGGPLTYQHDHRPHGSGEISNSIFMASPAKTEALEIFDNADLATNEGAQIYFDDIDDSTWAVPWRFHTYEDVVNDPATSSNFFNTGTAVNGRDGYAVWIGQAAAGVTNTPEGTVSVPLGNLTPGLRYFAGFLIHSQSPTTTPSVIAQGFRVYAGEHADPADVAATPGDYVYPADSEREFDTLAQDSYHVLWTDFTYTPRPTLGSGSILETVNLCLQLYEHAASAFDGDEIYTIFEAFCVPVQYGGGIGLGIALNDTAASPIVGDTFAWNLQQDNDGKLQRFLREAFGAMLPSHATDGDETVSDTLTN